MTHPHVLILAGGLGTRLRAAVQDLPKPMADIGGKPFLEHQIEYLKSQGFSQFTILAGYKGTLISDHFGNGASLGVEIQTIIEKEPLGTGGAAREALEHLRSDRFLLLNGDSMKVSDYRHFLSCAPEDALVTIGLHYTSDLSRYGSVRITPEGHVDSFVEKSKSPPVDGYINAGVYLFSRSLLPDLPQGRSSLETGVFPHLLKQKKVCGVPLGGRFIDIGTPESYALARERLPSWLKESPRPCLFLDRDGTLIRHVDYLHKPEDVEVIPEMIELLKIAKTKNWWTVIVTNQSGVARGLFTENDCEIVHAHIDKVLAGHGLKIDAWFFCPYHPKHGDSGYLRESPLRKPEPGMLLLASESLPIDMQKSVMIGDAAVDEIRLAGLRSFFVQGDHDLSAVKNKKAVFSSHAALLAHLNKTVF